MKILISNHNHEVQLGGTVKLGIRGGALLLAVSGEGEGVGIHVPRPGRFLPAILCVASFGAFL